jgi:hypothetical protein
MPAATAMAALGTTLSWTQAIRTWQNQSGNTDAV